MRGVNSHPLRAGDGTQFMLYRKVADEESRADESSQHFSSPWFGRHHLRAVDMNNDLVYNGLRSRLVSPVDES